LPVRRLTPYRQSLLPSAFRGGAPAGGARFQSLTGEVGGDMYFTDRGIEELAQRRGDETVTIEWLADQLRDFVDLNPEFETPIERFATWLARLDDEDDE
jgi:hypothetical protein